MPVYCVTLFSGPIGTAFETWAAVLVEAPTAAECRKQWKRASPKVTWTMAGRSGSRT